MKKRHLGFLGDNKRRFINSMEDNTSIHYSYLVTKPYWFLSTTQTDCYRDTVVSMTQPQYLVLAHIAHYCLEYWVGIWHASAPLAVACLDLHSRMCLDASLRRTRSPPFPQLWLPNHRVRDKADVHRKWTTECWLTDC